MSAAAARTTRNQTTELEKIYKLAKEDLYLGTEEPATKKLKLDKLLNHVFVTDTNWSPADVADPHVSVIYSLQIACAEQRVSALKLEATVQSKNDEIQTLQYKVQSKKDQVKENVFIEHVKTMPQLKKGKFMEVFTLYGGFLTKMYMEATPSGLKEHKVTSKHPFAQWCLDTIFLVLEKPHSRLTDINKAEKDTHGALYTNGVTHFLNNDAKRAIVWQEIGPHFVQQMYQKRNTFAENLRHAICEYPTISTLLTFFPINSPFSSLLSALAVDNYAQDDGHQATTRVAIAHLLEASLSSPRSIAFQSLAPAFTYILFLEGHKRCKYPFLDVNGISSVAFSTRNRKATPKLSHEGMVSVNKHYLSSIVKPAMEALAVLWFAKYLLHLANKTDPTILKDGAISKFATTADNGTITWPVSPWSDKGSRKTYTDLDYKFFFRTRLTIEAEASKDELLDITSRFMYNEFTTQIEEELTGAASGATVASSSNSSTDHHAEDEDDDSVVAPCSFTAAGPPVFQQE